MFGLGMPELIVIFLIVFLLFGAKNLPEIARSIGKALKSFKKGIHEVEDEVKSTGESIEGKEKKDTPV